MLSLGLMSLLVSVPLFSHRLSPTTLNRVTCIVLIFSRVLALNLFRLERVNLFNNLFHIGPVQSYMDAFMFMCGLVILIGFSPVRIRLSTTEYDAKYELIMIILFIIIGQSMVISSIDLFSLFISLELQSFAVYVTCTIQRDFETATIAGLKYFMLGALSRAIILLGIAILYYFTGTTQFEDLYALFKVISITDFHHPIVIGLSLILIGFLFKVARAPLHFWAPDVYNGVPTVMTMIVQTLPKISILVVMLQLLSFNTSAFTYILLYASLRSLVIGTVVGLSQYRIKRLLAYSRISHVGFMTLCLVINDQASISIFLFYLVQYSLTNICMFLCILGLCYTNRGHVNFNDITQLKSQFKLHPLIGLSMIVCLFSMAGVPPLIGFYGKMLVLAEAIEHGYVFITVTGVIVSVISAAYYLKIVKVLCFDTLGRHVNENERRVTASHSFAITMLTLMITSYILMPEILLNVSKFLAISIIGI